jgi:phosphoribosylformylglycinamidine synthase
MGEEVGAEVQLDKVPLKYAGLRYDEIWISEAQERMVLSVPREKLADLLELSAAEDVESTVIGTFGTADRQLVLHYKGQEVGRLSMEFLHHGIPMPRRRAVVRERKAEGTAAAGPARAAVSTNEVRDRLLQLLAHPNIASKHWVIRQYDHEVQGGSVIKPLVGPHQRGPSDAAVIRPKLDTYRGVALAVGMAPQVAHPYDMALASIDEAVRNAVAVGADPGKLAVLDNFCWPSVDDDRTMGALVAACEACRDAALAYGIPFISGKDSLHNQFTNSETGEVIRIPNTLLISAIGVVDDVRKCVTMDLKKPGNVLYRVEAAGTSLEQLAAAHRAAAAMIGSGQIAACHDVSDGGWLVAAAEMCIASGLGLLLEPDDRAFFDEPRGQYLVEFEGDERELAELARRSPALRFHRLGPVTHSPELVLHLDDEGVQIPVEQLTRAWRDMLDW